MKKLVENFKNFNKNENMFMQFMNKEDKTDNKPDDNFTYMNNDASDYVNEYEQGDDFDLNTTIEDTNNDNIDDDIQAHDGDVEQLATFNPNDPMLPREWSIIKHMTNHGVRLGMCYSNDIDANCQEIESNLDYETACKRIDKHSMDLGISEFDSSKEKYLGGLRKSIISKEKPSDDSKSYGA